MELSSKSSFILRPQLSVEVTRRRPSAADLDLCSNQLPYKTPSRHRLLPARAEDEGYSRSNVSPAREADRRRRSIYDDADKPDSVSVWDSNAEGIRGNWRSRNSSSLGPRPMKDSSSAKSSSSEDNQQWWRNGPDDDEYAVDEDDDDDDQDFSWFGLSSFDMPSPLSILRWMLPAAVVIVPWFFGGPMFLMAAFAFFPFVRKFFGAALQGLNGSSKSRRRDTKKWGFWRQSKSDSFADSREDSDYFNSDIEDWETSLLRSSLNRESNSKLGGWDEEKDNVSTQKKTRRPKKKVALERRWSRKEMPLFFRLLVFLFPFLRSWGGFL